MDPVGKQKRIASSDYRENFQKCLDNGGAKKSYDGISYPKATHAAREGRLESRWQGTVKGGTTHKKGAR